MPQRVSGGDANGFFEGRHYSDWSQDIPRLERAGDTEAAEILLRKIVDATEVEAEATGQGVAPYAYERLAVIARKRKDLQAETAILERFVRQKHARATTPPGILARLEKVWKLQSSTLKRPSWLSRMAANVLFVDVETTGLGDQDRVISIACILLRTASLAEGSIDCRYLHLICDPGRNSHPKATAVHGYSDWLLRHQQPFADIVDSVVELIEKAELVVAHNADFDLGFINAELVAHERSPVIKPVYCTVRGYRARNGLGSAKLDHVAAQIGFARAGSCHGALEDAWLAMMVYLWLHDCPHRIPFAAFEKPQPSNMRPAPAIPMHDLPRRKRVPRLKAPRH